MVWFGRVGLVWFGSVWLGWVGFALLRSASVLFWLVCFALICSGFVFVGLVWFYLAGLVWLVRFGFVALLCSASLVALLCVGRFGWFDLVCSVGLVDLASLVGFGALPRLGLPGLVWLIWLVLFGVRLARQVWLRRSGWLDSSSLIGWLMYTLAASPFVSGEKGYPDSKTKFREDVGRSSFHEKQIRKNDLRQRNHSIRRGVAVCLAWFDWFTLQEIHTVSLDADSLVALKKMQNWFKSLLTTFRSSGKACIT